LGNKGSFTKILAILGAVLIWLPILAPFVFALVSFMGDGKFRFDYLMPAELFPLALIGSGLLLWAAFRARRYFKLIGRALGAALILLFGGQALASITGLASGAIEPTGWQMALVTASIIAYALALVVIGVNGILLLRVLFKSPR
jgi:hypothetical protein